MSVPGKYPSELRQRAVRLVLEAKEEDPGLLWNGACVKVGKLVGVHGDTLRTWVTRHQVDAGQRPGTTSDGTKKVQPKSNTPTTLTIKPPRTNQSRDKTPSIKPGANHLPKPSKN